MQWLKPKNQIFYVAGTMWWFIRLLLILSVHNLFDFESYFHFPFTHYSCEVFPTYCHQFLCQKQEISSECVSIEVSALGFVWWVREILSMLEVVKDHVDRLGFVWMRKGSNMHACRVFILSFYLSTLMVISPLSVSFSFCE